MREEVTIWYTGAQYQLGRWRQGYGIWAVGSPQSQPVAQWPETPDGWSSAWSRFAAAEPPGAIVRLSGPPASAVGVAGSVILLAVGLVAGLVGLFPAYLSRTSLAAQPAELAPHAIYLASWAVSGALIVTGGVRRRVGALLGLGVGVVTFGFFFADMGSVLADGAGLLGPGLVLSAAGWLACTVGAALALRPRSADAPRRPQARPAGPLAVLATASLAAVGAAIAFAPSWDSYTLRTSTGFTQTVTAGNSFANPGPVIAGDVTVMAALVAVVVLAAIWRPLRLGAALLAGAVIPMAAQAASAIAQITEAVSPAQFGISQAQAAAVGLTISAGLTPVFWIYCAFVGALLATGVWMLLPARSARQGAPPAGGAPWAAPLATPAAGTSQQAPGSLDAGTD